MITKNLEIRKRKSDFLSQLNLSDSSKRRYKDALSSLWLNGIVQAEFGLNSVFEMSNLEMLWKLYSIVNLHPVNVRLHRYYSSPIMQYIKFLNGGKKYGKRIDYNKKKEKNTITIVS